MPTDPIEPYRSAAWIVQTQFGHTSPAMTAKYVASLTQTSVSAALGKALAQETR